MFVAFDGTETHAEAVAIKDGKFVYVGDETGIAGWIGDTTTVVDCHGAHRAGQRYRNHACRTDTGHPGARNRV